jgi:uncharacterized protein YfaP (DUF2135 family)
MSDKVSIAKVSLSIQEWCEIVDALEEDIVKAKDQQDGWKEKNNTYKRHQWTIDYYRNLVNKINTQLEEAENEGRLVQADEQKSREDSASGEKFLRVRDDQ